MFWNRAAALVAGGLVGGLLLGCQPTPVTSPQASAPAMPSDEASRAQVAQSWRATHPGSEVGVVNAVLPARRLVSVAGLPLDQVQSGNVISILLDRQGGSTIEAVVVSKDRGFAQLAYQSPSAGQRDPQDGDLAVWFPGGPSIPPSSIQPTGEPPMTEPATGNVAIPPATQPANETAPPMPTKEPAPPATEPAAPATQPAAASEGTGAATEPASGAGTASQPAGNPGAQGGTETPPAGTQEKPDLNK